MRHRKISQRFGRLSAHRTLMFRNMAASLIDKEVIQTTLPKAKALRRILEPLVTLAKTDSVANRRLAFDRLRNRDAVQKLFHIIAPAVAKRPGGYLRILKCGYRQNDAAPMAFIEFVDKENFKEKKEKAPAKKPAKKTEKAAKPEK